MMAIRNIATKIRIPEWLTQFTGFDILFAFELSIYWMGDFGGGQARLQSLYDNVFQRRH